MRTFTDASEKIWTVDINVGSINRVKEILEIDLGTVTDATLRRLATDPSLLVSVLFQICEQQATAQGVTAEQFARGFKGDAIERATEALIQEIIDFTPGTQQRQAMRSVYAQAVEAQTAALKQVLDRIERGEFKSKIEMQMQTLMNNFGV